ncbi:hypothetical protein LCGC14_2496920 [marine sediment metagenome]|uniref:EthD domain-containing protein n=1 Tax=marine sediment metagenome TaxID=412755 RepID=A0A0F9B316_9ZZZZ
MIKLVYCARRLPGLSREEFQRYWRETHGPLVRSRAKTLRVRRYVQVHTLESPVNDALREGRGSLEPYDGVAELWWDSAEELTAVMATPEGQRAGQELLDDERRFIDLEHSALWIAEEHPIVEA